MKKSIVLRAAACAAVLLTAPAGAAPVTVNVRVEGSAQTYFEGPVTTDARAVLGHPCATADAPNMITALDDAATADGPLFWSGTWYDSFGDFFVDEIGTDAAGKKTSDRGATTSYWVLGKNFQATEAGGCQTPVKDGDRLLFAFGNETRPILELSGTPVRAKVGEAIQVLVTQHATNQAQPQGFDSPAPGATVEGQITGPDGIARVTFGKPGLKVVKATREGSVRSNAGQVCVYVPGSGDCGTAAAGGGTTTPIPAPPTTGGAGDPTAQRVTVALTARTRRALRGSATGTGVGTVQIRLRRYVGERCSFLRDGGFARSASCGGSAFLDVPVRDGRWALALDRPLRSARYTLTARVRDRSGTTASTRARFRVR